MSAAGLLAPSEMKDETLQKLAIRYEETIKSFAFKSSQKLAARLLYAWQRVWLSVGPNTN